MVIFLAEYFDEVGLTSDAADVLEGLVIFTKDYDNFNARVTYRIHRGKSALYFRATDTEAP